MNSAQLDVESQIASGNELIARALERTGTTKVVSFGYGVAAIFGELLTQQHGPVTVVFVADETTWSVAQGAVTQAVTSANIPQADPIILPATPRPYAAIDLVDRVRAELELRADALPIAVGSGTINDAVKLASYQLSRPYWVVGTAPSMDGYTAAGASISKDGFKQNISCAAPVGVVMDLDILATAPQIMWASGFGDMIGKISALADWRVAEAMGAEGIDQDIWDMSARSVVAALADPAGVGNRDVNALPSLAVGLLMSGLAIQAYNSSRPGSGAEHMFSHLWEMEHVGLDYDPPLSHGAKVGVGSVLVAAFYDQLLELDLTQIDIDSLVAAWPSLEEALAEADDLHGDSPLRKVAHSQLPAKYPDGELLRERLDSVRRVWPSLRAELRDLMRPADEIRENLTAAHGYNHPSQLQLSKERIVKDCLRLRTSRNRYTSFDLAAETGVLSGIVDSLLGPHGTIATWPQGRSGSNE